MMAEFEAQVVQIPISQALLIICAMKFMNRPTGTDLIRDRLQDVLTHENLPRVLEALSLIGDNR